VLGVKPVGAEDSFSNWEDSLLAVRWCKVEKRLEEIPWQGFQRRRCANGDYLRSGRMEQGHPWLKSREGTRRRYFVHGVVGNVLGYTNLAKSGADQPFTR